MFSFPLVRDTSCPSKRAVIDQTRRFLSARLIRDLRTLLSLSSALVHERASFLLHPADSSLSPSTSSSNRDDDDVIDEAFQWSSKHSTGRRLRNAARRVAVLRGWEHWDSPVLENVPARETLASAVVHVLLPDEEAGAGDDDVSKVVFARRDVETLLAAAWVPGVDGIVVISLWENEHGKERRPMDVPLLCTPSGPVVVQVDEPGSPAGRWSYHDAATIPSGKEGWNEFVRDGAWQPELSLAEQAFATKTAYVLTKQQTLPKETQGDADGDDYWNRYCRVEENETTSPTPEMVEMVTRSKWSTIQASEDQESTYWDRYAGVAGALDDDGGKQGKTSTCTTPYSHLSPLRVSTGSESFCDDWLSSERAEHGPFLSAEYAFSSSVQSASARAREFEVRREFVIASFRSTMGLARASGFSSAELMSMISEATKEAMKEL